MNPSALPGVVIYGGTAPAIVTAVRVARSGHAVTLVTPDRWLGGSLPSLGAVETHFRGVRAPLLQEFIDTVIAHYRQRYGEDSEQFGVCTGGTMITFEPHVAEGILRRWVENESGIQWLGSYVPVKVERSGPVIHAVEFQSTEQKVSQRLAGHTFVDGSDEGDLMALAGAEFRVGREGRTEFGEPSAGRVFTRWLHGVHPRAAAEGRLNLVTAKATTSAPLPGSTGEGDDNIQSYSYRLCLTDHPANRRLLTAPPAGYDRARYAPLVLSPEEKERLPLPFHHRFLIYSLQEMVERDHVFHGHALPNRKRSWNATNLTGAGKTYAAASWTQRRNIEREHLDHALGLMWFLQNDSAVPPIIRAQATEWGLARDEFVLNDNIPPLYVREARRLQGRAVFTEHDALLSAGLERSPVHADSIGITEFSLDSLACTTDRLPPTGALCDGQLFQMEVSRPGQVPFGVILPRCIDNLLVVTTVSATHVGWGTVRQTPTLMHLAESAAWAIVLAARQGIPPAALEVSRLQRHLVAHGVMISFFNDVDMACPDPWLLAMQFLATRRLFPDYNAAPSAALDPTTARAWQSVVPHIAVFELTGLNRAHAAEIIFHALAGRDQ